MAEPPRPFAVALALSNFWLISVKVYGDPTVWCHHTEFWIFLQFFSSKTTKKTFFWWHYIETQALYRHSGNCYFRLKNLVKLSRVNDFQHFFDFWLTLPEFVHKFTGSSLSWPKNDFLFLEVSKYRYFQYSKCLVGPIKLFWRSLGLIAMPGNAVLPNLTIILSTGRLESPQPLNASVRLSVTTERLSKLWKMTGKKQARFLLGPQWPQVTSSKKIQCG